jgi:hydroxyethylthiazole kinase-like uncharacterized protein yjeF
MLKAPENFFRDPKSHKTSHGRLLVLAGSWGYAGAGILCARGAITGGCGYVIWKVSEKLYPVVAPEFLDGVVKPYKENEDVLEEGVDAVVAGPGWGQAADKKKILTELIENFEGPLILDADALNLLPGELASLKQRKGPTILTPHPGEAGRLLGLEAAGVNKDRESAAKKLQELSGAIIVLKGHETLVLEADKFWKNDENSATLATAGSGDVLAGLMAALCARGLPCGEAARFAVSWHGAAGKKLADGGPEQGHGASALFAPLLELQKEMN